MPSELCPADICKQFSSVRSVKQGQLVMPVISPSDQPGAHHRGSTGSTRQQEPADQGRDSPVLGQSLCSTNPVYSSQETAEDILHKLVKGKFLLGLS